MKNSQCLFCILLLVNIPVKAENTTISDVEKIDTSHSATFNSREWSGRSLSAAVAKERWTEINVKRSIASKDELVEKDRIALELIKLLEQNNIEKERWWTEYAKTEYKVRPPATDPCGECDLQLVDAVMLLKDKRALGALLGAIYNGGAILDEVVGYGKEAILPLTEQINITRNPGLKSASLRALGKISKRQDIDADSKIKIKNMIKGGLNDSEWVVRLGAVSGIEELNDPELIPLLEETIKKEDSDPKTKKKKRNMVKINGEKILGKLRARKREIEEAEKNKILK